MRYAITMLISFPLKEDHVWMSLTGFENYRVGDCLSFEAEVYRYIKTSRGKMIDFELKDPAGIRKVGEYEVPSDEQLRIETTELPDNSYSLPIISLVFNLWSP